MKALVVDDDRTLAGLVTFALQREGFEVVQAHDGEVALRRWAEEEPDVIVLDVNMPKVDGFAVCRRIRAEAETPIIMLTVRGDEDDVVRGLELGADDYIPKPFSPRQLVARIHAVLRRAGRTPTSAVRQVGRLTLDPSRREVQVSGGDAISLTPLECQLLELLTLNAGQVLTHNAIIDHVWGPEGADRDMLRQVVHRLREKIEPDSSEPIYIETVPGLGYGLSIHTEP
ncbi:MAG: response regulator transcription factor [Anaerolineae bacterium]